MLANRMMFPVVVHSEKFIGTCAERHRQHGATVIRKLTSGLILKVVDVLHLYKRMSWLHPRGLCQGAKYQHGVKLTNWEKTLTIWNGVVNKRKGSNQFGEQCHLSLLSQW